MTNRKLLLFNHLLFPVLITGILTGCPGPRPDDVSLIPPVLSGSDSQTVQSIATSPPHQPVDPLWHDGGVDMQDPWLSYPFTRKDPVTDVIHGVPVADDFRWLENAEDPAVGEWTRAQVAYTRSYLDQLPQRDWLSTRFREQFFYDDSTPPAEAFEGTRSFWWEKKRDDEHWSYHTRASEDAEPVVLLNPNDWEDTRTLDVVEPSRDGKYMVFGIARGGDENPVLQIMDVETQTILPDTCRGWRQGSISWLPDNIGFYYTAHPLKGEVPDGEEHYWHSAWFHKIGTLADQDIRVYHDDSIKEAFHQVIVSEEGTSLFYYRLHQNRTEISIKRIHDEGNPIPVVSGADGFTSIQEIEGKLFFWTDVDAPMGTVWVTDVESPEREHWKPFIPETSDRLEGISLVAGKVYATYLSDVHTVIKIYNLEGEWLRDLPLPELCRAVVYGYWHRDRAKVWVSSFNRPATTYEYDFADDSMSVYHDAPIKVDSDSYAVEQVFYPSRDGTRIPMFLFGKRPIQYRQNTPTLLNGYGGFGAAMNPMFSAAYLNWVDAGGIIAIACTRGGGEYGKSWHEAGKKEKKQNVFDDFIAAAEWLIRNGVTKPERLVIKGESNGGLLVGAVAMQRPELFKAVFCGVPLLDMIRYHKFGIANLWESEYGSAEDPAAFQNLMTYSPYHNVKPGIAYPSMLIQAGINDARVDPMHARKMVARLQTDNPSNPGRALLLIWDESGHGGGTDLTTLLQQQVDVWGYMMDQAGLKTPAAGQSHISEPILE